jgi:2-amino-4-hydroxy-6-hydroxymethyldihydropteridine diphosphokinase
MPNLVYISLGSNLGDRKSHLEEAIRRLKLLGNVRKVSSLYETEPVEFTDQPWFLNCAIALETSSTPAQLMQQLLEIETGMGRQRVQKKGPRIIDIDILLFGEEVVKTPEVTIPHPAMHQRRFVLVSMAQIARTATHPVLKKTIQQLLHELPKGQIVKRFEEEFGIDLTDSHGSDSTK